jgi:hypothetical protein
MSTTPPKKIGRPSKYDPALCDKVVELGRQGKSVEQISATLGIPYKTLLFWKENHPEFLEAMDQAKLYEMAYWEDLASQYIVEVPQGAKLNTGLWSRSMAARFPAKYRENSKVEVTGKDDKPIQVDVLHDFSQSIVDDLLAARQTDDKPGTGK